MNTRSPTHFELIAECHVTRRLETWSRLHAAGMLVFTGAASAVQDLRLLFGFFPVSFIALVVVSRGRWSPQGDFGWGNGVTLFRLLLVMLLTLGMNVFSNRALGVLAGVIFLLDGLDGWIARRTRSASNFGAHFDMETDAVFIAVVSLALWQRSMLGVWVLAPGLYRYLYVVFNAIVEIDAPEMPRSWFGRIAYSGIALGLTSVFLLPREIGVCAAWVGTGLVTLSFARSFAWVWSHRAIVKPRQLT